MSISCEQCRENWDELLEGAWLPEGSLTATSGGQSPVPTSQFQEHLQGCPECARDFQILRAARVALRQLPVQPVPADLRSRIRSQLEVPVTQAQAASLPIRSTSHGWRERFQQWLRPTNLAWSSGLAVAMFCLFLVTRHPTENAVMAPQPETTQAKSPPATTSQARAPQAPVAGAAPQREQLARKPVSTPVKTLPAPPLSPGAAVSPREHVANADVAPTSRDEATPGTVPPAPSVPRQRIVTAPRPPSSAKSGTTTIASIPRRDAGLGGPAVSVPAPASVQRVRGELEKTPARTQIRIAWLPAESPRGRLQETLADRADTATMTTATMAAPAAVGARLAPDASLQNENAPMAAMPAPGEVELNSSAPAAGAAPPSFELPSAGAPLSALEARGSAPAGSANSSSAPGNVGGGFGGGAQVFTAPPAMDAQEMKRGAQRSARSRVGAEEKNATAQSAAPPRLTITPSIIHRSDRGSYINGGGVDGGGRAPAPAGSRQIAVPTQNAAPGRTAAAKPIEKEPILLRQNAPATHGGRTVLQGKATPHNTTPALKTMVPGVAARRARVQVQSANEVAQAQLEVLLSPGLRWADAPAFPGSTPRVVWQGRAGAGRPISVDIALQPQAEREYRLTVRLIETAPAVLGGLLNPSPTNRARSGARRIIEEQRVTLPSTR